MFDRITNDTVITPNTVIKKPAENNSPVFLRAQGRIFIHGREEEFWEVYSEQQGNTSWATGIIFIYSKEDMIRQECEIEILTLPTN
jgi:hypothetical protein